VSFGSFIQLVTHDWSFSSVERIIEYLDVPQEPVGSIETNPVPAYWPSRSSNDSLVVVEDLVIKYAPQLPAVLHAISFSLKAKEHVGLLGRTGLPYVPVSFYVFSVLIPAREWEVNIGYEPLSFRETGCC
jgi:ABC-type multidrug transport system fused ATPase/permease subunit